jgi:hypothetical protein
MQKLRACYVWHARTDRKHYRRSRLPSLASKPAPRTLYLFRNKLARCLFNCVSCVGSLNVLKYNTYNIFNSYSMGSLNVCR